ncbi:MAG: ribonuclease P protein component [Leptospiraceae bacterium]|nr:ribonuclease P protein component [Leptospiraceae bacterium]MCP5498527.1 ribonuclease P protein component [Leptospiraceae bacterium]
MTGDNTLRSKKEIQAVFKKGKKLSSYPLRIFYLKNGVSITRFLYCSDRTARTAVRRNRVKRVLRACIRELESSVSPGFDIAIIASYLFTEKLFFERIRQLKELLQKIDK